MRQPTHLDVWVRVKAVNRAVCIGRYIELELGEQPAYLDVSVVVGWDLAGARKNLSAVRERGGGERWGREVGERGGEERWGREVGKRGGGERWGVAPSTNSSLVRF